MISHINRFRESLTAGKVCLGTGITLNDPVVVEALAPLVDFFWIDLEHNPIDLKTLLGHLIAARAGGAPAIVRVPSSDLPFLKRVLDTGAEGIIVPQVRSAAEVTQVVQACRYTPLGNRGWGPRRPSDYGRRSQEQIVREANEQLFVAVQIENTDALVELDEIVSIPGIDSLVVGPFDLSCSMNLMGKLDHPDLLESIETIIRKSHEAGLFVGVGDEALAKRATHWVELGADWVQCGGDVSYLLNTAEILFSDIRSSAKK